MSDATIEVLIVDDSDDLAQVLEFLIDGEADMRCAGRLCNADGLIESVGDVRPRVVLLDLTMPGRSPLEAMSEASGRFPETRFVVLSGYDDPARVDEAVQRGAWGFVSKHGDVATIVRAIRAVAGGEVFLNGPRG